ncbi:MAG: nuclear transport factor 2 family protein [Parafilimonas sp.]
MTNIEIVRKMNDGFVKGDMEKMMQHFATDVRWNVIGASTLINKKVFKKDVNNKYFIGLPTLKIKNEIQQGDWVAVEGEVLCKKNDGSMLHALFFDVYRLENGKIKELRSYVIERNKPVYLSINNY